MPGWGRAVALTLIVTGIVATAAPAQDLRALGATDLDGRTVRPLAMPSSAATRGVVLVFTRSDCPIANRYAPDLERLQRRAAAASVDFWLVFVDPAETGRQIRQHLREYGFTGRALHDPQHTLVRAAGVTIAPEAAVFTTAEAVPRLVYRGRIDDRYLAPGRMRPAPTTRDLEAVMEAIHHGGTVPARETQAVGCVIADLR